MLDLIDVIERFTPHINAHTHTDHVESRNREIGEVWEYCVIGVLAHPFIVRSYKRTN